jgi:hypothetical protein
LPARRELARVLFLDWQSGRCASRKSHALSGSKPSEPADVASVRMLRAEILRLEKRA